MKAAVVAAVILVGTAAQADLRIDFVEGAPKDRFVIVNNGDCPVEQSTLTLDLATASAGVIFDVSGSGAGVEVFQPFVVVSGGAFLTGTPEVLDGDTAVTLELARLGPGQRVVITTDVDDTAGGREITVSDGEIAGAQAVLRSGDTVTSGIFEGARASVPLPPCTS